MDFYGVIIGLAGVLAASGPVVFASIGETISERAGVINLSVNGTILLSAMGGFAVAVTTIDEGLADRVGQIERCPVMTVTLPIEGQEMVTESTNTLLALDAPEGVEEHQAQGVEHVGVEDEEEPDPEDRRRHRHGRRLHAVRSRTLLLVQAGRRPMRPARRRDLEHRSGGARRLTRCGCARCWT